MFRLVLALLVAVVGCGDDTPGPSLEGGAPCSTDEQCDDSRFCNGLELCLPASPLADDRGCAVGALPCMMEAQTCIERNDACVTLCEVTNDADGDGVAAVECGGIDCADNDRDRFPGNIERCDGAGHDEDCVDDTIGEQDIDGDGAVSDLCYNTREDGTEVRGPDCSDVRGDVFPGAEEICDHQDNDCDGEIDEGIEIAGFADMDGDGDGDPSAPRLACAGDPRFSLTNTDCVDDPMVDGALTINGFQQEICDHKDNDCDGEEDENAKAVAWYPDTDGDLFGDANASAEDIVVSCNPIPGYSLLPSDCNDARIGVNPTAAEVCDGLDNDCNGLLDAVFGDQDLEDDDLDGIADIACRSGGSDCDDNNPLAGSDVPELCDDLVDNDCDGLVDEEAPPVDWYADLDSDGYGDPASTPVSQCSPQVGRSWRLGDCDDTNPARRPGFADLGCDMVDQDCDGVFDEDSLPTRAYYLDEDGDGAGVEGDVLFACTTPPGYGALPRDCAPADPAVTQRFPDVDRDLFGGEALLMCTATTGIETPGDCNDSNPDVNLGTPEICDGIDNNCDGLVDENGGDGCPAGSVWECRAGECVFDSCLGGFESCDGNPDTGCESNTMTDPRNCGSCTARVCGAGAACMAGTCETGVTAIEMGLSGTCVTRPSGNLGCWGSFITPLDILLPSDGPFTSVTGFSLGRNSLCANSGGSWQCVAGASGNDQYELGLGRVGAVPTPVPAAIPSARMYALGDGHSCAVATSGGVSCWGDNRLGAVGDGTNVNRQRPVGVGGLGNALDVSVSDRHSCAVNDEGDAFCWGENQQGELGDGSSGVAFGSNVPVPVRLEDTAGDPVLQISAGLQFTCAVRMSGAAYCWGVGFAVGNGAGTNQPLPGEVVTALGVPLPMVAEIVAARSGACARQRSGAVWCWGPTSTLGTGAATPSTVAVRVPLAGSAKFLAARDAGVCAVLTDDSVWCWGIDSSGRFGQRATGTYRTPVRVFNLP